MLSLSIAVMVLWVVDLAGQNAPQYSLFMMDRYQFNPAFAGLESSLSVTANYRTQWVSIPGNPIQEYVDAHLPVYLWKGALGMSLQHESIGAQKVLNVTLSYNYVQETPLGLFSAGIGAGFTQQTLDGALLRTPEGVYEGPTILHNDPILPNTVVHGIAPVFNAGVYFAGKAFEAGIAMQGYTPGTVHLDAVEIHDRAALNFFAEYYLSAIPELDIYPSLFVQSDLVQTQSTVSVRAEFSNFATLGVGVRGYNSNTFDAVILMGGLRLSDRMHLYYAYDLTLSSLSTVSEGSHELMLRYNLNKVIGAGLPPPVIYSPRF